MAQFIATLTDHFEDNSILDGNVRLVIADSVALALLQDGFLDLVDSHWTEGAIIFTEDGTVVESGGVVEVIAKAVGAFRAKALLYPFGFNNGVYNVNLANIRKTNDIGADSIFAGLLIYKDDGNRVMIGRLRNSVGDNRILFNSKVGGGATVEHGTFNTVITSNIPLELQRAAGNKFKAFYDVGAGPVQLGPEITKAIGADCSIVLYSQALNAWAENKWDDLIITGSGVYRDDSPEYFIVKSVIAGNQFTLDAGVGEALDVTSVTFNILEPANTSALFQWATETVEGVDDRSAASFNGSWLTAAQLNTNVSAATLKRFLYIKGQANSDSSDTIDMQDMTFNYDTTGGYSGLHTIGAGINSGIGLGIAGAA